MNSNFNKMLCLAVIITTGIIARFLAMSLGHNFDFDSYCIVGELASNLKNVYANTPRYNYAPIFFMIQGISYKISSYMPDVLLTYRVIILSVLVLTDVGIMLFIYTKYSAKAAFLFFLNPISIYVTGYHNQFDNIAVLLALLAACFFNKEKEFNKKDVGFVIFMSLCLMTKHILFIMPLWILFIKGLPIVKKIVYSCVPPFLFLLSFVPFALSDKQAMDGIIHNVFLYRSENNAPLLGGLYNLLHIPEQAYFFIFILIMAVIGYLIREREYELIVFVYLISLVTFSSAVATQYLAIPMAAVTVFGGKFKYLYWLMLINYMSGGNTFDWKSLVAGTKIEPIVTMVIGNGFTVACMILFMILVKMLIISNKEDGAKNGFDKASI
ncbi:MAG: hypothetical protein PHQ65_17305 [Bacteroidales bacterium]|nr:hypothetical protein [Bacteroidales bacterium]